MLKYLISLVLLTIIPGAYAQGVKIAIDSVQGKFIPTGIRVGADLIAFTKSLTRDDFKDYNLQADIDFYRYFLNLEYGLVERTFTAPDGIYNVEGSYFRVGPDINFLHRDPDRSALFFGLRYARGTFSDNLRYSVDDPFYGIGNSNASNSNLNTDWFEMVTGLKVRLLKTIWLGYTARFKFGVDTFERNALIPHEIPGYGRADETVTWGFNYYLIFRIPVRKDPYKEINLKEVK